LKVSIRSLALALAVCTALPAGVASSAVIENTGLVPSLPAPVRTAQTERALWSDLILWRNPATVFDGMQAPDQPDADPPNASMPHKVLEVDLFGTRSVPRSLP
jgi:hypothetical protein